VSGKADDTLGQKAKGLFGSLRFWTVTLGAVAYGIAHPAEIADTIAKWLGAVTLIGSADSVAEKFSSKKPT